MKSRSSQTHLYYYCSYMVEVANSYMFRS